MERFKLVEKIAQKDAEVIWRGSFEECDYRLQEMFADYSSNDFYTIENKTDLWFSYRMPSGTKGFVKIEPYGKD